MSKIYEFMGSDISIKGYRSQSILCFLFLGQNLAVNFFSFCRDSDIKPCIIRNVTTAEGIVFLFHSVIVGETIWNR